MIFSVLKKLPIYRRYTTNQFKDWWRNRKVDWKKEYLSTWNHPHRFFITKVLRSFPWLSLLEIGCGGGANLANIVKGIPGRQVGGVDINPDAIALAEKSFKGGFFKINSADDIMMSDKSVDVILSDMTLIYVGPFQIGRYIKEMRRLARSCIVLCEFHSDSWWNRLALLLNSGHHAYNYRKLLEKHGFYDIMILKIPSEAWPDGRDYELFRHIIVAKVPKR